MGMYVSVKSDKVHQTGSVYFVLDFPKEIYNI